ncbi:MAG TPA: ABC transporter permease [Thermodesulfobacteriota bacterium]|nr:ABC transporter permease [Thermodesulfobacteriota bacterium]
MSEKGVAPIGLSFSSSPDGFLLVRLKGDWKIGNRLPSADEIEQQLKARGQVKSIGFEASDLKEWDSRLLTFLVSIKDYCSQNRIVLETDGLPEGARRLLKLATTVPEREGARKKPKKEVFLDLIGAKATLFWRSTVEMVDFLGEASVAFGRLVTGRAYFRRSDLVLLLQECGVQALPIVSLISVLVGLILAFVGAIELKMFGAQIYVANVVGIGMVRIMGAIMTGIIMAGRTGASFAARIGTMQVNEEIDALQTFGISPMEFLVLPRMVALIVMMPLLCLYADVMGILGGIVVGMGMLDLSLTEYLNRTREAVTMTQLWIGLFHGAVFGVLVAMAGCLRGMQCGRSASAVGEATTSAVVTSIVAVIVATAVITLACQVLGI